jgi:hypothetical protein
MPTIYYIKKRNNNYWSPTRNNNIALNNLPCFLAKWSETEKHYTKFMLKKAKFIASLYQNQLINDYTTFWIEYEMPTYYLSANYSQLQKYAYIHFLDRGIKNICNIKKPHKSQCIGNKLQNTDPFLFSKEWYWGICKKRKNVSSSTFNPDDMIIFGDHHNSVLKIYCIFIIKDDFFITQKQSNPNKLYYKKLPFLFVYNNLIRNRCGRKKFFQVPIHRAKKYNDDPKYFSYVPGKVVNNNNNNIDINYIQNNLFHQPASINLTNYPFLSKISQLSQSKSSKSKSSKSFQNYIRVYTSTNSQNILNAYNAITQDILNQGFVLIIDFI